MGKKKTEAFSANHKTSRNSDHLLASGYSWFGFRVLIGRRPLIDKLRHRK